MNNPSVADVIANYRNERLNRLYRREQEIGSLPGMQDLLNRKKAFLKKFFLILYMTIQVCMILN